MKRQIIRLIYLVFFVKFSLFVQAGDINLSKYRIVTHSSSSEANHCGHLVVDGCIDTYWESLINRKNNNPFYEWLEIDLNTIQLINQVNINWGSNYATEFKLSLLSDSKEVISDIYKTKEGDGSKLTIDVKREEAQYIRIEIRAVKDAVRGCVINEIEVMGEGEDRFEPSKPIQLSANKLSLNGNMWRVQNSMFVKGLPEEVSLANYNDKEWIPATVPGTVLGDYYNFGALPDPLYGDNMHQISDEFFSGNDFWYRTKVNFPSEFSSQRVFIDFSGINWKSDIYFNGKLLGNIDGAFMRGSFEVTDLINFSEINTVAVLVHHNENWVSGTFKVIRKTLGAKTTNGDMLGLDGPTSLASAGWNWLPIIKGRNNGIWNSVNIRAGGNVSIEDPWVASMLPLPDTTQADLTINTELKNHTSEELKGNLVAEFDNIRIELPVILLPNEEKTITLSKEQFKELSIKNPKLWWPNGYGAQHLSKLNLKFVEGDVVSDTKSIDFGIRQLEYKNVDGVLFIHCNGYRIQLKGGNWGLPEAMMRLDSAGYDLRVKLHHDAHFNMIRNWIGMTNRKEFYEACDRYGVLIFDDFWLANPKNGPDPEDFDLFMSNVQDKIKWVRKHPSLAFYCGRNEGLPILKYDLAMKTETELLDGTRHYVPHSAAGTVSGFGPYEVKSPEWYFRKRGATLHSEIGIIAIPELESIRKMMPEKDVWPISDMWAIHDYQYGRSFKYTEMLNERYGTPNNIEEYSSKAQLQNYETGKAMFECLQSAQGSGMILWMSQSAWPSMICQLYDHYLEYTSSYFAVKKGSSPIHAFWDPKLNEIRVANNTKSSIEGATLLATIYNSKGEIKWTKTVSLGLDYTSVKTGFALEHEADDKVLFLKLELTKDDKLLSDNFYWLENEEGNCLDLNDLPLAKISMEVKEGVEDTFYTAQITLKNESMTVSLLNKIKLKDKETGESILPVFYDDDYISLLPNEEKVINIRVEYKYIKDRAVEMQLEGWNTINAQKELTTK